MNPIVNAISFIGVPLGIVSGLIVKLFRPDFCTGEGFTGICQFLGWCFYCGIATIVGLAALMLMFII